MKNKKIILTMLLFSFLTLEVLADYSLKLSYGMMMNDKFNGRSLAQGSYDITAEMMVKPLDFVSFGFGLQYVWPDEFQNKEFTLGSNPIDSSMPVYGVAIYNFMPDSNIAPYIIGRLGYGFTNANPNSNIKDIAGDAFYSLGVGGTFKNFFVETTYDVNTGNYTMNSGYGESYDYTRFTVRFGYWFKFIKNQKFSLHDEQKTFENQQTIRTYDNLEVFDEDGSIKYKKGDHVELRDFKIID